MSGNITNITPASNVNEVKGGYYSIGEFEGKERIVRFDLNAFAEMERIYGSMEAANEALSRGSMRDVRTILWLGLIHDQAVLDDITGEPIKYTLTQFEVGRWLTPHNMKDVMEKLNEAISGSVPEDAKSAATKDVEPKVESAVDAAVTAALAEKNEDASPVVTPFRPSTIPTQQ